MTESNIDTAKLEGLLSKEARRFLDRAKEQFEVPDIEFPADWSYSLAHVLNSTFAVMGK